MGLREESSKRRAINKYRRELGSLLRKRYGRSDHYTSGQIRTTIEKCGLNVAYSAYALAMYLPRDDFDSYHRETGEACDYDALFPRVRVSFSLSFRSARGRDLSVAVSVAEGVADWRKRAQAGRVVTGRGAFVNTLDPALKSSL